MGVINEIYQLQQIGCTDIQQYTLVSNHGFTFSKGGVRYDLRYWENCYGVYGGGWSVHCLDGIPTVCPSFKEDFDAVIEWIKNNL